MADVPQQAADRLLAWPRRRAGTAGASKPRWASSASRSRPRGRFTSRGGSGCRRGSPRSTACSPPARPRKPTRSTTSTCGRRATPKGLDETTANALAAEQANDPDAMLRLLTAEELGGAKAGCDPVQASLATGIFAGVGGATYAIGLAFS